MGQCRFYAAWLQVSNGEDAYIAAMFKTKTEIRTAGWVIARQGCWTMLKGGFTLNISTPVEFYFEVPFYILWYLFHKSSSCFS